jgi:two-component system NtrC family sensor kinase/two-component system sensor histidine kinase AtoS
MITSEELQHLIEQTYKVENDFKELKNSYQHLQDTIEKVVEFLPNAIWILEKDGKVFLQNSQAKELSEILVILRLDENDYEINFRENSYLVRISNYEDKYLVSVTDITEQKRKENLATMGQMAAHLSHEIRNPIGSIALLASTLKKRVKPENVHIVTEIEKSIFRIERIIKATLMFSKGVTAEKKTLCWKEIQDALSEITTYYSYSKEIEFRFLEDDFTLYGDFDLLLMMFSNFLINAIDAIELDDEEAGIIELTHEKDEEFHYFYIYDSGVPIENKKALFEAFKSTKVKGNGLGLILSKQIATAHDGDVFLLENEKKIFEIKIKS